MSNIDKILALLKLSENLIDGRVKFQKLIYILKNNGVDFTEKYKYHYFGPFSFDLQLELEELVDQNVLKVEGSSPYKYSFGENYTNEGVTQLEDKKKLIEFLNKQDSSNLELIATIYYLKNSDFTEPKAIKNKLKILKPKLCEKIEGAYQIYEELPDYA